MKASYRWLGERLPGLDLSSAEAARRLTAVGLEIEGEEAFGAGTEQLLVARVVAIEPHPTKSGLRLVTVERGGGTQRVVCGAPNVPEPGGLVVLAPLGATLPAVPMTIVPRAIGGVTSEGMLCSETEMGIGSGNEGILILEQGEPGQRLPEVLPGAQDTVFEVNVTPNRPDALGHRGIARDLAAALGRSLPPLPRAALPADDAGAIAVQIEAPERCAYFGAVVLEGVVVGPSPRWVQQRLFSLGIRPISNLVDLTNLVMLELGQPLHAYDLDQLRGGRLVARLAHPGETLATLDGKTRELHPDDLVIADAEGAVGVAGVMGGASSEIRPGTTRVVLEAAYFEPRGVRRSAKRHGLHTDASHRFERGIDRLGARAALERAVELLKELAPAARVVGFRGVEAQAHAPPSIRLRSQRLDDLLGDVVPFPEAIAILKLLGCEDREVSSENGVAARWAEGPLEALLSPPPWRPDLLREADLIEEVGRMRGYDRIKATLPAILPQTPERARVEPRLLRAAVELGLSEAITYAFVAPRELAALGAPPAAVTLLNPLTEERSVLRTSLLPGLLEAVGRARRHGEKSARVFTTGHTFHASTDGQLPVERRGLAVVLAGPRPSYLARAEEHDVFDAKSLAIELIERSVGREARVEAHETVFGEPPGTSRPAHLHPRAAGRLLVGDRQVGTFGLLHPDALDKLELQGPIPVIELDVAALDALGVATPKARPIPKMPPVTRDMALEVAETVAAGEVERLIREVAGDLCERVELFDVYRGANMAAGKRSLAFHVIYRDPQDRAGADGARTLTDAEVDARQKQVETLVNERLGATLRA
jgi:phenylalanyl-tRNA synthetase beta chain